MVLMANQQAAEARERQLDREEAREERRIRQQEEREERRIVCFIQQDVIQGIHGTYSFDEMANKLLVLAPCVR
jgi:hypothetical protein